MYKYSKSTATHGNADALSRLPLPETLKDPPMPAETVLLLEQLSESPISMKQIKLWTRRDPILSRVLQILDQETGTVYTRWSSTMGK